MIGSNTMIEPIQSVSAVLHRRGRYVAVFSNKRGGAPVIPGGKVEPTDESLAAACSREVYEEAGLVIEFDLPNAQRIHVGTEGKLYHNHVFYAEIGKDVVLPPYGDEGEIGWLSRKELIAQSPFGALYEDDALMADSDEDSSSLCYVTVPFLKHTGCYQRLEILEKAARAVWPEAVLDDDGTEWAIVSESPAHAAKSEELGCVPETKDHFFTAFVKHNHFELVHDEAHGHPLEQVTLRIAIEISKILRGEK